MIICGPGDLVFVKTGGCPISTARYYRIDLKENEKNENEFSLLNYKNGQIDLTYFLRVFIPITIIMIRILSNIINNSPINSSLIIV